jgi:hypothetical protein
VCTVSAGNVLVFLKFRECGKHLMANFGERATITLYIDVHEFWPSYGEQ